MRNSFLAALALLISSCAVQKEKPHTKPASSNLCEAGEQTSSHAAIFTQERGELFSGCFQNYFKHNPDLTNMKLGVCVKARANSAGAVTWAKVSSNGGNISNDLRWCLEQQMHKMDYSLLQFGRAMNLSFPLNFEVRK